MLDDIYQETRGRMGKTIAALKNELKRVRTGRASLSLLDGIRVDYYGTLTPLNQMATLSVPESRLITIQPWDVSVIKEIEKAILKSPEINAITALVNPHPGHGQLKRFWNGHCQAGIGIRRWRGVGRC